MKQLQLQHQPTSAEKEMIIKSWKSLLDSDALGFKLVKSQIKRVSFSQQYTENLESFLKKKKKKKISNFLFFVVKQRAFYLVFRFLLAWVLKRRVPVIFRG